MPSLPIPARVGAMLGLDEPAIAIVPGVHDSGMIVTSHRLLAWRSNGVSAGVDLADIDRVQYDRGSRDALLIIPRAKAHAPLVVLIDASARPAGEAFLAAVRQVVSQPHSGATVRVEEGEFMGITTMRFVRG